GGRARLEHESGLREVELFGDRLHGLGVEPAWLPKYREGVATERSVREYVDEPVLVASHRFDLAETRRRGSPGAGAPGRVATDGAPAEGRGVPVALRGFRRRVSGFGSIISVLPLICVPLLRARRRGRDRKPPRCPSVRAPLRGGTGRCGSGGARGRGLQRSRRSGSATTPQSPRPRESKPRPPGTRGSDS